MITFIVQLMDWINYGQSHYFVLFFVYVWVVWGLKAICARRYRRYEEEYETTVSVVIPVFKEDPEFFNQVLASIHRNKPDEMIVIVDGGSGEMVQIANRYADVFPIPKLGKRAALEIGILAATGQIIVIVDSDTIWNKDTLQHLIKPFRDPNVGGVTTQQRIFNPNTNLIRRFCDWMEDLRFTISTPAQSSFGTVGCLSGRTIAFRRKLLMEILDEFLNESFLGVKLEIGDDRCLTNFTLRNGYKTVYQDSALVFTDCPNTLGKFVRQQIRWARSSQRETLRNLGWLVKKPFLAFCFLTDIITPFFLVGVLVTAGWRIFTGIAAMLIISGTPLENLPIQLVLSFVGMMGSIGIRQVPHFRKHPRDFWLLPIFVIGLTVILTPVRIIGFLTMADNGWMTRCKEEGNETSETLPSRTWTPYTPNLCGSRSQSGEKLFPLGGADGDIRHILHHR